MSSHASLLCDAVPLMSGSTLLVLNSAGEPFVPFVTQHRHTETITLAEDNIAVLQEVRRSLADLNKEHQSPLPRIQHMTFHDALVQGSTVAYDIAVMNLLYQPTNAWIWYGLRLALVALKPGGCLYVTGAKDRGILTVAKRMRDLFGNVETLTISKGQRVVRACKSAVVDGRTLLSDGDKDDGNWAQMDLDLSTHIFAGGKLDEGTRSLLDALEVRVSDSALDLGCGAGLIGLHIAHLAREGRVTMVDASLAAVAASQRAVRLNNLKNIRVLPSDGAQAVSTERFDLVVTNPPFHQGGMQTTSIAERFILDAASVLVPRGRCYLVANRFLKYEPVLASCFKKVQEVGGDSRYKVLLASNSRNK